VRKIRGRMRSERVKHVSGRFSCAGDREPDELRKIKAHVREVVLCRDKGPDDLRQMKQCVLGVVLCQG